MVTGKKNIPLSSGLLGFLIGLIYCGFLVTVLFAEIQDSFQILYNILVFILLCFYLGICFRPPYRQIASILPLLLVVPIIMGIIKTGAFHDQSKITTLTAGLVSGISVFTIGFWVRKNKWDSECFLHFRAMRLYFTFALVYLSLFAVFYLSGVYNWIARWEFGSNVLQVDTIGVLLAVGYIFIFLLVYLDSLKYGKMIIRVLKWIGKMVITNAVILMAYSLIDFFTNLFS
jgi:hypothetical protein